MNKKKIWIALVVGITCFFLIIPSSWAGDTQRHRWEGVALGIGAAILGHTLYTAYAKNTPAPAYHQPRPLQPRGHWEYQKVWVPPTYKKVWNPGHYNKKRQWVPGRYTQIVKEPGHWVKEKVWVSHNRR